LGVVTNTGAQLPAGMPEIGQSQTIMPRTEKPYNQGIHRQYRVSFPWR
jgi:hypothetical protein